MIFVVSTATSQNLSAKTPETTGLFYAQVIYQNSYKINTYKDFRYTGNKKFIPEKINVKSVLILNPVSCSVIAADYYAQGFGFFCKKELQFEKATKIPLRFRLGTLQYNNYLEGKPNTGILPSY